MPIKDYYSSADDLHVLADNAVEAARKVLEYRAATALSDEIKAIAAQLQVTKANGRLES